jgi:hypothetical protein
LSTTARICISCKKPSDDGDEYAFAYQYSGQYYTGVTALTVHRSWIDNPQKAVAFVCAKCSTVLVLRRCRQIRRRALVVFCVSVTLLLPSVFVHGLAILNLNRGILINEMLSYVGIVLSAVFFHESFPGYHFFFDNSIRHSCGNLAAELTIMEMVAGGTPKEIQGTPLSGWEEAGIDSTEDVARYNRWKRQVDPDAPEYERLVNAVKRRLAKYK